MVQRALWSWQFARQTAEQTAGQTAEQTADASLYAPVELFALKSDTGSISTALDSPDGKFVATAGDGPTARVWDSSTGKKVADLQGHTGAITAVAFSLDGTRVAAASSDSSATIWLASTGQLLHELKGSLLSFKGHRVPS